MPAKKSLAAALAEPPPHPLSVAVCHAMSAGNGLKKADRGAYYAAVDNLAWSGRQLSNALASNDIFVSWSAINTHRAGKCPCYRKAEK